MTQTSSEPVRFSAFDGSKILHGISTRHGGVSNDPFATLNLSLKVGDERENVERNRRLFEQLMGIESRQTAFGRLSHGSEVTAFKEGGLIPPLSPPDLGWPMFDSDAAISNVPGLVLVMTFADCVPILLWDRRLGICGLVHAGWRGTALRIASKTIRTMVDIFGAKPEDVSAAIGPSISRSSYPVGEDVAAAFRRSYGEDAGAFFTDNHLDLWEANRFDLASCGVPSSNVDVAGICTAGNTGRFFSHRGDGGHTGRFGACIGLRYPGRFGTSSLP